MTGGPQTTRRLVVVGSTAVSFMDFRGNLVKLLIREGYEVHVCLPDFSDQQADLITGLGVTLHRFPLQRNGRNPLADLRTLYMLRRLLVRLQPTHLLAYTIKPVIYCNLALRSTSLETRSVALITGLGYLFTSESFIATAIRWLVLPFYGIALARCERAIFQNEDDRALFIDRGIVAKDKTFKVAGSGVDVDYYRETPLPEQVVFLFIGRLLKDKGVMEYFEAARRLKQAHPHVHFLLAGFLDTNPASLSEHELVVGLDNSSMEFLGRLADVREAIGRCSVYVLPSYREGTPRTVLEAMSMGRAIITSDAPGCRETVSEGHNGLLVEPQSVESLVAAMEQMIENPDMIGQMGKMSRQIACEIFCDDIVNTEVVQLLGDAGASAG